VSNAAADSTIYPHISYTGGVVVGAGSRLGDQTLFIQSGAIREATFSQARGLFCPRAARR
jgi:hypothetical protein